MASSDHCSENHEDLGLSRRVVEDMRAETVRLKISKQGRLSKTHRMRDHLVENRISVIGEDKWSWEITTATLAHLAALTPGEHRA